jgi:hypothetical protein
MEAKKVKNKLVSVLQNITKQVTEALAKARFFVPGKNLCRA